MVDVYKGNFLRQKYRKYFAKCIFAEIFNAYPIRRKRQAFRAVPTVESHLNTFQAQQ